MLRLPLLISLTLALFCVAPGCSGSPSSSSEEQLNEAYDLGGTHHALDVPEAGNPYQGCSIDLSRQWLLGWLNDKYQK